MKIRAVNLSLLTILGIATTASSWSCGAFHFPGSKREVKPENHALAVDTTVVIIRVFNYQPTEVTVYLDTQIDRQRVGSVTPMHEAFFVLPSAEVLTVDEFILTVIPTEDGIRPYRTGLISRNRTRITMVVVAVGDEPSRESEFRGWAPSS